MTYLNCNVERGGAEATFIPNL
jgi:hypothetical protein